MLNIFNRWNVVKKSLDKSRQIKYFKEREVWWCYLGKNIGHEQDGNKQNFSRPVLIFIKFNNSIFLGLPLTTADKSDKYHFFIQQSGKIKSGSIIISQIKLFDAKRLIWKMGTIDRCLFEALKAKLIFLLSESRKPAKIGRFSPSPKALWFHSSKFSSVVKPSVTKNTFLRTGFARFFTHLLRNWEKSAAKVL